MVRDPCAGEVSLNCSNGPIKLQNTFEFSCDLAVALEEQERTRDGLLHQSQPDPDDLEDFALIKAEEVRHFGSVVGSDNIHQVIDQGILKNTQNETIPEFK